MNQSGHPAQDTDISQGILNLPLRGHSNRRNPRLWKAQSRPIREFPPSCNEMVVHLSNPIQACGQFEQDIRGLVLQTHLHNSELSTHLLAHSGHRSRLVSWNGSLDDFAVHTHPGNLG